MKKTRKIFAIIIALTLLLTLLCGCSSEAASESGASHSAEVTTTTQEIEAPLLYEMIYISSDSSSYFYYDRDTKVIYMYVVGGAITPLYNADGSLRLYNP